MLQPLSRWWPRALVASVMALGLAQLSSAYFADAASRASIGPTCATQERHMNVASVGQNFGAELALFEEPGHELLDCGTGASGVANYLSETPQ
jgi:hypothetical protein